MSHPPFFERYTRLVTETDLVAAMRDQGAGLVSLLRSIPPAETSRLHGSYTWTLKQVAGHIIDAERVFGYRALRFARGDATPLPGFDETVYANSADSDSREMADLADELEALRRAHVLMFGSLPREAWSRKGNASNIEWGVTDMAKVIVGHARHHERIMRQRVAK